MKKAINILSVISIAFSGLYLLSYFFVIIFQKGIFRLNGLEQYYEHFMLPISPLLNALFNLALAILVFVIVAKAWVGIWSDIVLLSCFILRTPISYFFSYIETIFISGYGVNALTLNSVLNQTLSYVNLVLGYSSTICIFVLGMSIVYKIYNKAQTIQ